MRKAYPAEQLPPLQFPIETEAVKSLNRTLSILVNTKEITGFVTMALVTGIAGLGKTVATLAFLSSQEPQTHTSIPACIYVKIPMKPTPKKVAVAILEALNESSKPDTGQAVIKEAIDIITSNDIKLIIVDEADWLDADCFEVLRYIHDEAQVSIAVVGLPQLQNVVRKHEKFASRVGLIQPFKQLEIEEVINTVLPNMIFRRWEFHSNSSEDRELGEYIWEKVKPSFRRLRVVLQIASQLAERREVSRIDRRIIEDTLVSSYLKSNENDFINGDGSEEELGEMEYVSVKRDQFKVRQRQGR